MPSRFATAHKEHRKLPFLKAFARIGSISGAAKASRISRDAVYDWRRNDPSFERQFQNARHTYENQPFATVDSSLIFFKDIIRPIVPAAYWPRISAELALATTNLKNGLKEGRHRRLDAPSVKSAVVSLSLDGFADVAIPNRGHDASAPL